MIKKKLNTVTTIASGSASLSAVIDATNKKDFAVQVIYGAGSSTTSKLQASNDGSHYADVTNSTVTLDATGGSVLYNVSDFEAAFCKVVVTGDAVSVSILLSAEAS